ncbi:UNVERIFIED_CONTAM: excreted virulence factor EspC (type VII ESX diderm) [Williamsia faeni]
MDDVSGPDLLVDEAVLAAAARRLAPVVGEIDEVLAEVDAIIGDLRHDCSGHHTGADFDTALAAFAGMTAAELHAVRNSIVTFTDNLTRAAIEFGEVDEAGAADLRRAHVE